MAHDIWWISILFVANDSKNSFFKNYSPKVNYFSKNQKLFWKTGRNSQNIFFFFSEKNHSFFYNILFTSTFENKFSSNKIISTK